MFSLTSYWKYLVYLGDGDNEDASSQFRQSEVFPIQEPCNSNESKPNPANPNQTLVTTLQSQITDCSSLTWTQMELLEYISPQKGLLTSYKLGPATHSQFLLS